MTGVRCAAVAAAVAAIAPAPAGAEPADLRLHEPPAPAAPAHLAMRAPDGSAAAPSRDRPGRPSAAASPATSVPLSDRLGRAVIDSLSALPDQIARLDDKVVFRMQLGVGIDGGEPRGATPTLASGAPLVDVDDGGFYAPLRTYTFGDAVVGTRGLLVPSLATYFASQFRVDHAARPPAGPVPTVFDEVGDTIAVVPYYGYAEVAGISKAPWLRPLFVRAGRQFRYGPAIAHFDGVTLGYDGPAVSAGAFAGQRVALFGFNGAGARGAIRGADVRVNLYRLRRTPLVIGARALSFDDVAHLEADVGLQVTRDVLVRSAVRARDGVLAREHASMRARLSRVTTLFISIDNRHARDWSYDLLVGGPATDDPDDPRRYLGLGTPLPRLRAAVRAGTVLFDNVDLLVRGAIARQRVDDPAAASPFFPSYSEAGAAAEVRFRRSLRVGAAILMRRYRRAATTAPLSDVPAVLAEPLAFGERSFFHGDLSLHYNTGIDAFEARAEFYSRVYRGARHFAIAGIDPFDVEFRSGARFDVRARVTDRLRLRAEYETAFAARHLSPEIVGTKSLRAVAEATF
ncbi:MAG: hypothetical protein D6689_04300 [Deltaproteobacteria bacterium]|nr:MAG: hypothetical protein D6689_04300 [Deltaproteobacteria bacterium]